MGLGWWCLSTGKRAKPSFCKATSGGVGASQRARWRCVPARSVQVAFLLFKRRHLHPLLQLLQERSAPLPACQFVRARWHSNADIRVFRADRLQRPSSSMASEHGFACAVLVHCQLKFLLSPFCFLLLLLLVGLGKLPSQRRSLGGHYCRPSWAKVATENFYSIPKSKKLAHFKLKLLPPFFHVWSWFFSSINWVIFCPTCASDACVIRSGMRKVGRSPIQRKVSSMSWWGQGN